MAGNVARFANVMRKLVAMVALVLVAGGLPVMASLGICARRACCHSNVPTTAAPEAPPACCNENNCPAAAAGPGRLSLASRDRRAARRGAGSPACGRRTAQPDAHGRSAEPADRPLQRSDDDDVHGGRVADLRPEGAA